MYAHATHKSSRNLLRGKPCPCREISNEENLNRWKLMHSLRGYKTGQAVIRVRTDLKLRNPALRDWPAFRITTSKHPRVGKKYKVWPLMNFAVAVDDHAQGVTHVIRGKDHIVNTERQLFIYKYMAWKAPEFIHVGRINFKNMKLSASETREAIESGHYEGWYDIRLPFIQALRRRGIQRDAFVKYAISVGLSKVDKTVEYSEFMQTIYSYNKEIVEPKANRYFFVADPVKISVENAPKMKAELELHPSVSRGKRKFTTTGEFYISKEDFNTIQERRIYRLMNLFNFSQEGGKFKFHSRELDPKLQARLIHWLPTDEKQIAKAKVLLPDAKFVSGFCEIGIKKLNKGQVVQFERFGFCCSQGRNEFWYG
ncbi:MAG: glutamate--tRNA ligase family protein, partial [Nanoarchaeota archaeon]